MSLNTEMLPDPLPAEPLTLASQWLAQAWHARVQPNPDAMVLATSTPDGRPSARVVLCKALVADPGYVAFYTNYESRKAEELAANPRAAIVMHWDALSRQVRIEGPVVKAPVSDSQMYFDSRHWEKRVGAWASAQSRPLSSRSQLLAAVQAMKKKFGSPDSPMPCPPYWGGYRLWAQSVELWVAGDARIHDRARWVRELSPKGAEGFAAGPWVSTRLQP